MFVILAAVAGLVVFALMMPAMIRTEQARLRRLPDPAMVLGLM